MQTIEIRELSLDEVEQVFGGAEPKYGVFVCRNIHCWNAYEWGQEMIRIGEQAARNGRWPG